MKTIIYYRKSTDREDKQANSLEHQLENCRKTAKLNSFEVVKEISESRSAKIEGTRLGFNELIKICKTGKIDYIIIDEAKRLSRNNLDSARVIDLFDKGLIKGVYSTGRVYLAKHINDVFLLQLDLSLSKMDNAHRSKDIKEKMQTCVKNQKRFLGKAPFGYKNITIKKGHKIIEIDKKEALVVKEIFNLRLENKAYSTIGNILKEKYGNTIDLLYRPNRLFKLVKNKFYCGVFKWNGEEHIGTHQKIISKKIYDLANGIGKGIYEQQKDNTEVKIQRKYLLKGFIKDNTGIKLTAYNTKGVDYYGSQYRSNVRVNIGVERLYELIGEYIKSQEIENKELKELDKEIILDLLRSDNENTGNSIIDIENSIKKLREKQEKLLDMKLEEKICEEIYLSKNNKLEEEILKLNEEKNIDKNYNYEEKTKYLLELTGSFYQCYKVANEEGKVEIIKKLMLELFIDNKKELKIEESPLFKSSKMLNFSFGTPKGNGTPVWAVRGPRPSH